MESSHIEGDERDNKPEDSQVQTASKCRPVIRQSGSDISDEFLPRLWLVHFFNIVWV
jgi:hypothetical protein